MRKILLFADRKQGGEEGRVSRMREKKGKGQLEGRGWSQGGVFIHIQYGRAGRKEGRGGRGRSDCGKR
jgi:hypothetical protein